MPDGTMGRVAHISWQATHVKSLKESKLVIANGYALRNVVHNDSKQTVQYAEWLEISTEPAPADGVSARRARLGSNVSCTPGSSSSR